MTIMTKFPRKILKEKNLLIIEIIFSKCVNSLNPVYNSASLDRKSVV